jgi:chemotaxis protein methyltransferase CheR
MQWSSPDIARIADAIREWTGLTFPAARAQDVESTIQREMQRRGMARVPEFLRLLHDEPPVRDALVADLTIGETYFHRDPAQFALLREQVLPELLARPGDRSVRAWSAGCASGEEPYTVAMLFDELDALDRAQIVGTDISRPRLLDAQRGIYGRWSLRGTGVDARRRYFRERGRFYELTPRIRRRVDYRYLNLAEDRFPSLSVGVWGMDVILCRNVLIYFDRATVARVARRLIASLSEDGWLILGASDPAIAELVECDVVLTDSGLVYRRPGAAGATDVRRAAAGDDTATLLPWGEPKREAMVDPPAEPHEPPQALDGAATADALDAMLADATPLDAPGAANGNGASAAVSGVEREASAVPDDDAEAELLEAYAARDFDRVATLAEAGDPDELGPSAWVAWVRALANQGCLREAAATAQRAVERHGPSAELLYLNAVLLLEAGNDAEAGALARRALYLDRSMVVAHMTLADAQRRAGDADGARRALRNAATLLDALPDDTEVAASDGERAGRLRELVSVKLRLLSDGGAG